jgi:hypothetical protein
MSQATCSRSLNTDFFVPRSATVSTATKLLDNSQPPNHAQKCGIRPKGEKCRYDDYLHTSDVISQPRLGPNGGAYDSLKYQIVLAFFPITTPLLEYYTPLTLQVTLVLCALTAQASNRSLKPSRASCRTLKSPLPAYRPAIATCCGVTSGALLAVPLEATLGNTSLSGTNSMSGTRLQKVKFE